MSGRREKTASSSSQLPAESPRLSLRKENRHNEGKKGRKSKQSSGSGGTENGGSGSKQFNRPGSGVRTGTGASLAKIEKLLGRMEESMETYLH